MRKIELSNGEFYHVYNHAVENRNLFDHEMDYRRFYESIYLFNDSNYQSKGDPFQKIVELAGAEQLAFNHNPFVRIISYCLMPNHYHFFVEQLQDEGISKFFHKLNMGYGKYFNTRYNRRGTLFEGTFKATPIQNQSHFLYLPIYIHLNPLDLTVESGWRNGKINDWNQVFTYLSKYQWSSHLFYSGVPQEYPIVDEQMIHELFLTSDDYQKAIKEHIGNYFDVFEPNAQISTLSDDNQH